MILPVIIMFLTQQVYDPKPHCNILGEKNKTYCTMLNLYTIPLYSNVPITTCVSSLFLIFPAVFLNPPKVFVLLAR